MCGQEPDPITLDLTVQIDLAAGHDNRYNLLVSFDHIQAYILDCQAHESRHLSPDVL